MISMAIGSNPVACFSVIGFVNMRYDRSNVNTFLVVLTCRIQQPSKKFPQNSNTKCRYEFRNRVVGKKPWQLS